jgi:hypothetical protein
MNTIPNARAKEIRKQVFREMIRTRSRKYRTFLRYLRLFKYVAFAPKRGEFLESYYTLMRYLDDIVDGDSPLPEGYKDASSYIRQKIAFSVDPGIPTDDADFMMAYCYDVATRFGAEFSAETSDILTSLLFDANRRGSLEVFPKKVLYHHFHLLDIRGTIRATLKLFRDNPEKYNLLQPLGSACRFQYDLEDFESDIAAGYVNIPEEECLQFNIRKEDLANLQSEPVRQWLQHHAREGMELMAEHRRMLKKERFSLLQRLVFRFVYENPARNTFRKVLNGQNPVNERNK